MWCSSCGSIFCTCGRKRDCLDLLLPKYERSRGDHLFQYSPPEPIYRCTPPPLPEPVIGLFGEFVGSYDRMAGSFNPLFNPSMSLKVSASGTVYNPMGDPCGRIGPGGLLMGPPPFPAMPDPYGAG